MTNQQHTPGPWRINDWSIKGWSVVSNIGLHIASKRYAHTLTGQEYRDEMLQNAHLIAAAPELLGALECVQVHLEATLADISTGVINATAYPVKGALDKVTSAIKKAKGELD